MTHFDHFHQSLNMIIISILVIFISSSNCQYYASGPIVNQLPRAEALVSLPTVTVRGFLNFRTTVDGTVIVFTPASTSSTLNAATSSFRPTSIASAINNPFTYSSTVSSSPVQWQSSSMYTPRQHRVSTSQQVIQPIQPTATTSSTVYPTGLVTVLGQTEVNDGLTTVHQTKVIGTYIEGKYAQILKSSSFVSIGNTPSSTVHTPTPALVFPTKATFAAFPPSSINPDNEHEESIRPVFETHSDSGSNKNSIEKQFKNGRIDSGGLVTRITRNQRDRSDNVSNRRHPFSFRSSEPTSTSAPTRAKRPTRPGGRFSWTPKERERVRLNRFKIKPAAGDLPPTGSRFTARDENEKEAAKLLNQRLNRRLGVPRPIERQLIAPPTPVPKVIEPEKLAANSAEDKPVYNPPLLEGELTDLMPDISEEKLHISPQKVVTETQTYLSEITHYNDGEEPYIETATLTTLIERTQLSPSEPLYLETEVLAKANDLFPISSNVEATPPIVLSRTYSVTESSSRTSLVPLVEGTITTTHTITENFLIQKLITAYKTLPAGDEQLLENALSEMNKSNYLELLSEADALIVPSIFNGNLDVMIPITPSASLSDPVKATDSNQPAIQLQPSLNMNPSFGPQIDLNNPLVLGAALQNPGLAAMYFGLQQLSQQATQYTTITKPTEYLTTETYFNTKTLSFYDGRQTRTRTITEPASFSTRLVSTVTQEVSPIINPQYLVQQAQLQRIFATQLLNQNNRAGNNEQAGKDQSNLFAVANAAVQPQIPPQYQFQQSQGGLIKPSTIVSTQTTVITTTDTSTKVYTLIYNAFSTKFRTVTSTNIYPTTVTTLVTSTIQNTAPFPSFFG